MGKANSSVDALDLVIAYRSYYYPLLLAGRSWYLQYPFGTLNLGLRQCLKQGRMLWPSARISDYGTVQLFWHCGPQAAETLETAPLETEF